MTVHADPATLVRAGTKGIAKRTVAPLARTQTRRRSHSGFVPAHTGIHAIYNRSIGCVALLLVSPIMLTVALALLITQGPKILYAGPRLGKNRQVFNIYKFRTLDSVKARIITSDKVLPTNSNIETPLGRFLRASRLDELPQLLNIVRGDMNIVGPRPVRREIAQIEEARNPHYTVRFEVKPGLVGQTQAYMCHGTSKRIRAKYNYALCKTRVNYRREIALFVRVGLAVLGRAARLVVKRLTPKSPLRQARRHAEMWDLKIAQAGQAHAVLGFTGGGLCLAHRGLSGPAQLVLRTRSGGYRRARITLTPLEFSTNPLLSHSFECTTELSSHLVARFLHDAALVGPQPASKRSHKAANYATQGLKTAAE